MSTASTPLVAHKFDKIMARTETALNVVYLYSLKIENSFNNYSDIYEILLLKH